MNRLITYLFSVVMCCFTACAPTYGVDDHTEDTVLSFKTSLSGDTLSKYIDIIKKQYPDFNIPEKYLQLCDRTKGFYKPQQFLFFNNPNEIYNLRLGLGEIEIKSVFLENISEDEFLVKSRLPKEDIERIEIRLKKEIVSKIDSIYSLYK